MATDKISNKTGAARVAISNALADAGVKAAVAQYGYNAAKLNAGKALLDAADAAVGGKTAGLGDQKGATAQVKSAKNAAKAAFENLAKVARAIFPRDKGKLTTLGLDKAMPRDAAGLISAGNTLFDNALANSDIKAALAGYGYEAGKLTAEKAKVSAFDTVNQQQEAAKGQSQMGTAGQTAALSALDDWMSQFLKIARVALKDQPQQLEKLGIKVPVGPTPAQRAGRKKAAETRKKKKQPPA